MSMCCLDHTKNESAGIQDLTEVSWCHTVGPGEPGAPGMSEEQVQVYAGAGQLSSSL